MNSQALIIICLCYTASCALPELPSYIEKCRLNDPKLSECLLRGSEQIKPYLVNKGIPELKIAPIEPFLISKTSLVQDSQLLNFSAILCNLTVTGLSSYKFSRFDFNVPALEWRSKASTDNLKIRGNYSVNGTILGALIRGNGTFYVNFDNPEAEVYRKAELYEKEGVEYVRRLNTTTAFTAQNPVCVLEGLFDGDKDANKLINDLIKDNIDDLFNDVKPLIGKIISEVVDEWLANNLENQIPFANLYLQEKLA